MIIPCGHIFCNDCIRDPNLTTNVCPFCRVNIQNVSSASFVQGAHTMIENMQKEVRHVVKRGQESEKANKRKDEEIQHLRSELEKMRQQVER